MVNPKSLKMQFMAKFYLIYGFSSMISNFVIFLWNFFYIFVYRLEGKCMKISLSIWVLSSNCNSELFLAHSLKYKTSQKLQNFFLHNKSIPQPQNFPIRPATHTPIFSTHLHEFSKNKIATHFFSMQSCYNINWTINNQDNGK